MIFSKGSDLVYKTLVPGVAHCNKECAIASAASLCDTSKQPEPGLFYIIFISFSCQLQAHIYHILFPAKPRLRSLKNTTIKQSRMRNNISQSFTPRLHWTAEKKGQLNVNIQKKHN